LAICFSNLVNSAAFRTFVVSFFIIGNANTPNYWLDYHAALRMGTLQEACEIALTLFSE
jgi:hypothetical protein